MTATNIPFTLLTGTIVAPGGKSPANGITAVYNHQLQTLSSTTPGTPWASSAPPPVAPLGLCGSLANGLAIYGTANGNNTSVVAALSTIGVTGGIWNTMPALPGGTMLGGISGDLLNGLVAFSGQNIYTLNFNTLPLAWVTLAPPPYNVTAIAGDPTNGILIAVDPSDNGSGASALYYGMGTCQCIVWTPLTGAAGSISTLPLARVHITSLTGNKGNGFVYYGENQLVSLAALTVSAATASAAASVTTTQLQLSALPFAVVAISGDPVNGLAAIGTAGSTNSSGKLIATCPPISATATASNWTVVTLQDF
ncbi:hypothetical protein ACO0LB_17170 [Undibacterium sp. SXout7W]|uniref:hypothetical protein n=1 Tax=Undibacterium sp. SXout7W TaxID=3413049 RepID=UPI003BF1C029